MAFCQSLTVQYVNRQSGQTLTDGWTDEVLRHFMHANCAYYHAWHSLKFISMTQSCLSCTRFVYSNFWPKIWPLNTYSLNLKNITQTSLIFGKVKYFFRQLWAALINECDRTCSWHVRYVACAVTFQTVSCAKSCADCRYSGWTRPTARSRRFTDISLKYSVCIASLIP